jgi:hypothetical protein
MEDVIEVYEKPYSASWPIICFDESNKQQIEDVVDPLPLTEGNCKKIDAEYTRRGTSNIFMIFEPLKGWRKVVITDTRKRNDFALIMKQLVDDIYPDTQKITLVLDNLNIHSKGSLYSAFEPQEAKRIADHLEFHYLPKRGSWLNMAELELSALTRQCLKRRIKDQQMLKKEVKAWETERNAQTIKGHWTFGVEEARKKMKDIYPKPKIFI